MALSGLMNLYAVACCTKKPNEPLPS